MNKHHPNDDLEMGLKAAYPVFYLFICRLQTNEKGIKIQEENNIHAIICANVILQYCCRCIFKISTFLKCSGGKFTKFVGTEFWILTFGHLSSWK